MDTSGSVEDIFRDFSARRTALLKAFTTEFEDFYHQCLPQVDNLCLYGLPTGHWEVIFPVEEVPPDLPEPVIGINFSRDGMPKKDWLTLVALHSDVWLLSVAFYLGTRFRFDKHDRKRLFNKINSLPTLFEVVTGASKKQSEERSSVSKHTSSKSKSNSKVVCLLRICLLLLSPLCGWCYWITVAVTSMTE
ncbi:hypothetical protein Leryth_010277 [Lithospermum erythrorhizon]|nr:hypothetical protein Leryth_010277 [Lithospermum erythrorhizon]